MRRIRVRVRQKPFATQARSRETADHSMSYTAAVALMFGTVESRHFDDQFLENPDLLELVSKVKVSVSEEANARAPEAMLCDFEVVTKSGDSHSAQVAYHKGHYKNPLTDSDVDTKFRTLAQKHLTTAQVDALLNRLWHLEEVQNIGEVIRMTVF